MTSVRRQRWLAIRKLHNEQGFTLPQLTELFGIDLATLEGILRYDPYHRQRGPKDPQRSEAMLKLYNDSGMTLEQIGDLYHLSRERVRQILAATGSYQRRSIDVQSEHQEIAEAKKAWRWSNRPAARFWQNVDSSAGPDACWPWIGSRHPTNGYARVSQWGSEGSVLVHRIAYELATGYAVTVRTTKGTLGPGSQVIAHHCDEPSCCNPRHLFMTTQHGNIADSIRKGRHVGSPQHPIHKRQRSD